MCYGCFLQYTDRPVITEGVNAAVALLRGQDTNTRLLHVIVEDMNVEDCWFMHTPAYDAAEQWERDVFDALKPLSEAERATAIAIVDGYIPGLRLDAKT